MAATNKTVPFNLSQYVGGDRLKRLDYNSDMKIINDTLINATAIAGKNKLGQVIIGDNISVESDGTISVQNMYSLPPATASILGGVKIGNNINVDEEGTISIHSLSNSVASTSSTVGATSAAVKLAYDKGKNAYELAGTLADNKYNKTGGTISGNVDVTGSLVCSGNITAYSDIRLKENFKKIDNALTKVLKIDGYTFNMIKQPTKRMAGVIAQQIQTVLPEVVETDSNGKLSVAYGNIVALLIEAIKDQQKEIEELKKKVM